MNGLDKVAFPGVPWFFLAGVNQVESSTVGPGLSLFCQQTMGSQVTES